ncbi:uncharacterized protein DNG_09091 [Cephalotrichum gorgonifer]|uniref:2EXR domain-containing protein n=1 Tax=Cephalotrichum gorgonifer TaxID=2041049 RepID=A0AAE8N7P5_9PEZI|nr:uncharacterized protein DNG_09091 [Cephalotrichum gorgonifer]
MSNVSSSKSDIHATTHATSDKATRNNVTGDREEAFEPTFPNFLRLPFELQRQIWLYFCPALDAEPLVLHFHIDVDVTPHVVSPGPFLLHPTSPSRCMLAINQDTRQLALQALPDSLTFHGGTIRFKKERDLVVVQPGSAPWDPDEVPPWLPVPGFTDSVVNLTIAAPESEPQIGCPFGHGLPTGLGLRICQVFPLLETVYVEACSDDFHPRDMAWCALPISHRSLLRAADQYSCPYEGSDMLYCWPDLLNHREAATFCIREEEFPVEGAVLDHMYFGGYDEADEEWTALSKEETDRIERVRVWPLIGMSPSEIPRIEKAIEKMVVKLNQEHGRYEEDRSPLDGEILDAIVAYCASPAGSVTSGESMV